MHLLSVLCMLSSFYPGCWMLPVILSHTPHPESVSLHSLQPANQALLPSFTHSAAWGTEPLTLRYTASFNTAWQTETVTRRDIIFLGLRYDRVELLCILQQGLEAFEEKRGFEYHHGHYVLSFSTHHLSLGLIERTPRTLCSGRSSMYWPEITAQKTYFECLHV